MSNGYFNPKNHRYGEVYDLTQANMTAMIAEIDTLKELLEESHHELKESWAEARLGGQKYTADRLKLLLIKIKDAGIGEKE